MDSMDYHGVYWWAEDFKKQNDEIEAQRQNNT